MLVRLADKQYPGLVDNEFLRVPNDKNRKNDHRLSQGEYCNREDIKGYQTVYGKGNIQILKDNKTLSKPKNNSTRIIDCIITRGLVLITIFRVGLFILKVNFTLGLQHSLN
jgi:hypothetical protein